MTRITAMRAAVAVAGVLALTGCSTTEESRSVAVQQVAAAATPNPYKGPRSAICPSSVGRESTIFAA